MDPKGEDAKRSLNSMRVFQYINLCWWERRLAKCLKIDGQKDQGVKRHFLEWVLWDE